MNATELFNSTNSTGIGPESAPAGPSLRDWIRDTTAAGAWFATAWLTVCIFLTHWLGLYAKYPAVTIRWVLYMELFYNIILGPIKWWPGSAFHDSLALNPTVAACYWTIFTNTFIGVGLLFLGTLAAFSLYQITGGLRPIRDIESRKLTKRAAIAFWVLSLSISGLNVSAGYTVIVWCHSSSLFAIVVKFSLMYIMLVLQVYWVVKSLYRIFTFSRKVQNLSKAVAEMDAEDDDVKEGDAKESKVRPTSRRLSTHYSAVWRGIPRPQVLLALRFGVILLTEAIMVLPNAYVEFQLNFITPTLSSTVVKMVAIGVFLGPILDGTLVWTHEKVSGYFSNTVFRSTSRSVHSSRTGNRNPSAPNR